MTVSSRGPSWLVRYGTAPVALAAALLGLAALQPTATGADRFLLPTCLRRHAHHRGNP